MHYKYLNNNLRTFVKFLDQLIYALFRPAPADLYLHPATRIFTCAPPRLAPHIPGVNTISTNLLSDG